MTIFVKQRKERRKHSLKFLKEKSEKSFLGVIKPNENNFVECFIEETS